MDKVTSDVLPTGSERRREYLARKMGELAEATRKAADLLPRVPISGEVMAAAGIYATANLLDEVSRALRATPELVEEPDICAECGKTRMEGEHTKRTHYFKRRIMSPPEGG